MHLKRSVVVLSLSLLAAILGGAQQRSAPSDALRRQLAVVERDRLWKCHPGYGQFEQLDWEVRSLQAERQGLLLEAQRSCDMLYHHLDVEQSLGAERQVRQAQIAGLAREFEAKTEAELLAIHNRFDRQIAETMKRYGKPVSNPRDFQLMAASQVTKFRLEKQKALQEGLQAEQLRLDLELAHFEDETAASTQDEKVSLQLRLQLAEDEVVRRRLAALDDQMAEAKIRRRQQQEREMLAYTSQQKALVEQEVLAFEQRLQAEYQQQLSPPPELAQLRRQEQQELRKAQQARRAQLVQIVRNWEQEARHDFAGLVQRHPLTHSEDAEVVPALFLDGPSRARLQKLSGLLEKAQGKRREAYHRLGAGIRHVVEIQAQKRGMAGVLTDYRVNLGLEDLTDSSLAGVSQIRP